MALPVTVLALLTVLPIAATATSGEYQMGQREAGRERQTYSVQHVYLLGMKGEERQGPLSHCMLIYTNHQ